MDHNKAAIDHDQRTELLRANGRNPRLIHDLLSDAQVWDLLKRSCNNQIAELKTLRNSYVSKSWKVLREGFTEEDAYESVKILQVEIDKLERVFLQGIRILMETSKDLIQLVSI